MAKAMAISYGFFVGLPCLVPDGWNPKLEHQNLGFSSDRVVRFGAQAWDPLAKKGTIGAPR